VVSARKDWQVWLRHGGVRQLTGTVDRELASDAKRLGQDLVDRLVEEALREAERRSATA
jgi:hypothetical protein